MDRKGMKHTHGNNRIIAVLRVRFSQRLSRDSKDMPIRAQSI